MFSLNIRYKHDYMYNCVFGSGIPEDHFADKGTIDFISN